MDEILEATHAALVRENAPRITGFILATVAYRRHGRRVELPAARRWLEAREGTPVKKDNTVTPQDEKQEMQIPAAEP
jgi:hypothetical protein